MDWKSLQSGTDIRGVAMEGAGEAVTLTDGAVEEIAAAFALWLSGRTGKRPDRLTVSLGRDSRLSGERLRDDVCRALTAGGVTVLDIGMCTTPAMFFSTQDLPCDGAVQITASHHPWQRNGLKFFTPGGGLEGEDISEILSLCARGETLPAAKGEVRTVRYLPRYAARLRNLIIDGVNAPDHERPLAGFHFVVDAGNGVGGFYATDVLAPLGADISGSRFLEPNGRFPNHIPNPEDEEAMASVREATVSAGADLGIIFDTDVDRAGCVGKDGREINRNRLIALASAMALGYPDHPVPGIIVTDSVTSDGLKVFIEKTLGGTHRRFKRGYKNVINEAIRLNREGQNAPLAIETSGHAALRDNAFLDDGAYLVTRLIILAASLRARGETLEDLIAQLKEPAEECVLRFAIADPDFRACGNHVLSTLERRARERGLHVADDSCEGVRISYGPGEGDGFALLRLSVHDPVMPLNIESNRVGGCQMIAQSLREMLKECGALDTGELTRLADGGTRCE